MKLIKLQNETIEEVNEEGPIGDHEENRAPLVDVQETEEEETLNAETVIERESVLEVENQEERIP